MAKNYPRKQTVIIFIVCVIAVIEFVAYVNKNNPQITNDSDNQNLAIKSDILANAVGGQNSNKIADNDWQKQFLSGNKNTNINTNIKFNAPAQAKTSESKPLTMTDQIGRDLFTQYWQIHQAGLDSDQSVMDSVSSRFADQVAAVATPVAYSSADVKATTDLNSSSVVNYAKNLMSVLKNIPTSDAASIANDALNNKNGVTLSQIDPLIETYESIIAAMKNIPVPQGFVTYHVNLLNGISTVLFNAEALRKTDVDPIRGLAAISIYIQGMEQISNSLANLQSAFTASGIVFADSISQNMLKI